MKLVSILILSTSMLAACAHRDLRIRERTGDETAPLPPAGTEIALVPRQAQSWRTDEPLYVKGTGAVRVSLARRLKETRIPSYRLDGVESLREAVEPLALMADLPIVVTNRAEQAAIDVGAVFDLELRSPTSARSVLSLIVEQADEEIGWIVKDDLVFVTTRDKAHGPLVFRMYDTRIITTGRLDARGPRIDRIGISDNDDEDVFGSVERLEPEIDEDSLLNLVRDNVAPESWDQDGASIDIRNGILFVRNSADVQVRVLKLLMQLGI